MHIEDTARNRMIISASVLEQCNQEKLSEADYWARFIDLYNKRVGDTSGKEVASLLQHVTQLPIA